MELPIFWWFSTCSVCGIFFTAPRPGLQTFNRTCARISAREYSLEYSSVFAFSRHTRDLEAVGKLQVEQAHDSLKRPNARPLPFRFEDQTHINLAEETRGHILALPPELRLRIYEYLYPQDEGYYHCRLLDIRGREIARLGPIICDAHLQGVFPTELSDSNASMAGSTGANPHCVGRISPLFKTCKTLYFEAMPLVYGATVFNLFLYGTHQWANVRNHLKPLGPIGRWSTIKRIQHLEVRLIGDNGLSETVDTNLKMFATQLREQRTPLRNCFAFIHIPDTDLHPSHSRPSDPRLSRSRAIPGEVLQARYETISTPSISEALLFNKILEWPASKTYVSEAGNWW
ncbi:hypothetical protein LTR37_009835 [Vermiconidia calcicola]|uniref:Uncharacterized protein n=1 Tax=Vermiconidia calcicola TaxID=1690605 RepID=A0ACC3N7F6_9PEZI|nr:hypothetical protein LTR37_009835 [Vermiconidia calcicola]